MVAGTDAPSWTFGLALKVPVPLVPGPGTYNVGRELTSVGPRFGRIGTPKMAQQDPKRLMFDAEREKCDIPGPGAYDSRASRTTRRWQVYPPDRKKVHSPRFPDAVSATDAGPGAYVSPEHNRQGPSFSIAARPPRSLEGPESPGPGQYVRVRLKGQGKPTAVEVAAGFGNRTSPRFDSANSNAGGLGPGTYQDPSFKPSIGKDITFGRLIRPAGWTAKIRDIVRNPCELKSNSGDEDSRHSRSSGPCFRASSRINSLTTTIGGCYRCRRDRSRLLSSTPASPRLVRACARGRKQYQKHERSNEVARARGNRPIDEVIKKDGRRRRKAQATARMDGSGGVFSNAVSPRPRSAVFTTAPQRPSERMASPGPAAYHPQTLDEAAREGRVLGVGGKSGRELFSSPPDTPSPDRYSPEVLLGPAAARRATAAGRRVEGKFMAVDDVCVNDLFFVSRNNLGAAGSAATAPAAGTFGSSERFPKDPECVRRPGVGEYDLGAAERATGGASVVLPVTFGRRASVGSAPYDPCLGRYLWTDNRSTPSPHSYRPETAAGGRGKCGIGGHASAPPAWSFGGKGKNPRPPSGPGPGGRVFAYEPSPPAVTFGVGRAWTPGVVSGVPWEEAAERLRRGEGGGVDAKLYLPGRTRFGARAHMNARRVPVPRRG